MLPIEGLPSPFGKGTFVKTVLRGFRGPSVQTLHVGRIPMHSNQVPIGRPRFKVSHMRMSTFRGWELCPRASPFTISLARNTSDCALGSMIPRPPLDKRSVRESHLTLACVLEAFPPYEVSYHSSNLVAHPRIGVPACHHVPHWGKQYLVGNQNFVGKREVTIAQAIIFLFRTSMSFQNWPRWVAGSLFGCLSIEPLVPWGSILTWLLVPTPIPFCPC